MQKASKGLLDVPSDAFCGFQAGAGEVLAIHDLLHPLAKDIGAPNHPRQPVQSVFQSVVNGLPGRKDKQLRQLVVDGFSLVCCWWQGVLSSC